MKMKKCNALVFGLVAAMATLAVMGFWFCWHCPSRFYESHELFWRQLAWNGVGLAAFAGAWAVGWKRLLKAAPWLMAAWIAAFVMAQFSRPINGAHKWISAGPVSINVVTCFMPVFALFVAWLHDKKRIRLWVEWTAVAIAAVVAVWMFSCHGGWQERIAGFFNPGKWMQTRAYMSRQLMMAFHVSNWFGDAGRSLGFLPRPESDGMMSASALLFGKWFPVAVVFIFAVLGACLTVVWKCASDASRRRYVLLFGLWLVAPAVYCTFHSLALLPVVGVSPALASYGGNMVVMAWLGFGVLAAMARSGSSERSPDIRTGRIVAVWGAMALFASVAIAVAPGRKCWAPDCHMDFAEPRPPDLTFGEFGLQARRGRILAADGSPLAYTTRAWRFYLDPCAAMTTYFDEDDFVEIAEGLGIPLELLMDAYGRKDSRYIFLKEAMDGSDSASFFESRKSWLRYYSGFIREPVQKRVYPLGSAAVHVVGFMIGGAHTDTPVGAGGLEHACNKALAGVDGVYDKKLRMKERHENATPKPGADIQTTLVPTLQKSVAEMLAAVCATNGSESAWALVMKIPSGEIEAMASWPAFDPSMRRTLDMWNDSMSVNRAAQFLFEPGGLVKPLTCAIALDEGVPTEDTKLERGDGMASLIGPEKFHAALRRFGFGAKTRTAGIPGEESGILVSKPEPCDKTTAMRVGMGYGFAATALQIAQAYATLANHGQLVQPRLVTKVVDGRTGNSVQDFLSETNEVKQVVSPAAADAVVRMLKAPISSSVQMSEHDKESGRSLYSPTNYIASCAGYCPVDRPQHVIVVSFVKPQTAHTGDEVARPAFDLITDALTFFFCAGGHPNGGGVVCFSSSLNPTVFLSSLLTR